MLLKNDEKVCGRSAKKCARHVCDKHSGMQFQKGSSHVLALCWVRPYSAGKVD